MRALLTKPPGGWDHTSLEDVPEPEVGEDEVLVEIHEAGINPADAFQIGGSYPGGPKPPFIAGRDASGMVLKGDAGGKWKEGDMVIVLQSEQTNLAHGTFAERQTFSPDVLAPLPEGWSLAEGAAAPLVFLTAWQALVLCGEVKAGANVLVTGASGGVGLAAVQLAVAMEANVIALSRSPEKQQKIHQIGAHHVFSPNDENLKSQVMSATGNKGVDVVVENIGGPSLGQSLHLLAKNGRIGVVGLLAGVESSISIPSLLFKRARIEGVLVSALSASRSTHAWKQVTSLLSLQGLRPVVDQYYRFDQFREAFQYLESGPMGKVVLSLRDD